MKVLSRLQDFDTAKRHVGLVLTQYDPDNDAARVQFKGIKEYQKKIGQLRVARSLQAWHSFCCFDCRSHAMVIAPAAGLRVWVSLRLASQHAHVGVRAPAARLYHLSVCLS
jgi:hypothetical protein